MCVKQDNIIKNVKDFLIQHLDQLLVNNGHLQQEDYEKWNVQLISSTGNLNLANDILRPFDENEYNRTMLEPETKNIIAQALTRIFILKQFNIDQWLAILDWFNVHVEFFTSLQKKTSDKTYINQIEELTKDFFSHPEQLVFKSDRGRFQNYIDNWKNEKDIREVWLGGENSYFPFDYNAFSFPVLLFPNDIERFVRLCDLLKAPCIVYEFFAYLTHYKNSEDVLFELLQAAPQSIKHNSSMEWNQSLLAPALLHRLVSKRLRVSSVEATSEAVYNDAQQYFEKIGNILNTRDDGYFLARNYLQYLAPRKYNDLNLANLCINCIGNSVTQKALDYLKENPLSGLFPVGSGKVMKTFCETGILQPSQQHSICLDLLAQSHFFTTDDQVKELLPYYEVSLMYEDKNLPFYEASPLYCHYDAAQIYLACSSKQAEDRWTNTWNLFAMARIRMAYSYFDDMSIAARNNMRFQLLVGSALLHLLFDNKRYNEMDILWQKLWSIAKADLQIQTAASDEFNQNYAAILSVWKAKCESVLHPESAVSTVIQHVINLSTYPKVLILAIHLLQINHCLDKKNLEKKQSHELSEAIKTGLEYCEGMEGERRLYELGKKLML